MKKINVFVILFVLAVSISVTALQLSPITNFVSKVSQVTPTISLEEKDTCTTTFYDTTEDVIGDCVYYHNYTNCLNTTGPSTACSLYQDAFASQCKTGENTVTRNKTECKPNEEFIVSIDQGTATLKKQLDFSEWGPCVYSQETINSNSCLVVTCVSLYDGAHKGQFTDCEGGKSCQRFEICDGSITSLYKNSREDFVEDDESFHLSKLALTEVAK
jgi:hypothetical protein